GKPSGPVDCSGRMVLPASDRHYRSGHEKAARWAASSFIWRREGELIESALTPSSFRETQTGSMSCVVTYESNVLHPAGVPAGVGKFLSHYKLRSANIRRKQAVVTI